MWGFDLLRPVRRAEIFDMIELQVSPGPQYWEAAEHQTLESSQFGIGRFCLTSGGAHSCLTHSNTRSNLDGLVSQARAEQT